MNEIHQVYNDKNIQKKILNVLLQKGIVQLQEVLDKNYLQQLENLKKKNYDRIYIPQEKKISVIKIKDTILTPCIAFLEQLLQRKVKTTMLVIAKKGDYTLIKDKDKAEQGYDAVLDLTKTWNASWGGEVVYQKEQMLVPVAYDSITIVKKNNTKKYVKYVNHHARGERRFVIFSI